MTRSLVLLFVRLAAMQSCFTASLRPLAGICALALVIASASASSANDWLTRPSRYTHDPVSGYRVHQYAPDPVVVHTPDPMRSVYSHSRSTLQVGGSASYYHRVHQSGMPIRPYGEWRFPNRPFSVPYPQWGPQPFVVPGYGWGGGWGGGGWGGGGAGWGNGGPFGQWGVVNGSGMPWLDGSYNEQRPKPFDGVPFGAP